MRIEIPDDKKQVHEMTMPIRWGDMDSYRHVNNAVYFRYMEQARVEWIGSLGYSVSPDKETVLIVNVFCNFYKQVNYPGELLIKTYVGNVGKSSVDIFNVMAIVAEPEVIFAAGGATMVCVDLIKNKSCPWPKDILEKLR